MDLKQVMAGRVGEPSNNENLINPSKVSVSAELPAGHYKALGLDVLTIVAAGLFGYLYSRYLVNGISPWFIVAAGLFFGALEALGAFLTKSAKRRALVLLGEVAAFVVLFAQYDDWRILLLAAAVMFIVLIVGYLRSRSILENSIEIPFFHGTRDVLGGVTSALLLFMILVYAPQAATTPQSLFVPQQSFSTFFNWTAGFLNNFYPNVPFNSSFGDFSQSLARRELESNPTFNNLSPQAQGRAISDTSFRIASSVADLAGGSAPPTPTEQMSEVVYRYIVQALGNWQNHLQDKFIIAWGIVLFLILRTVGIVFVWLAELVTLVFYEFFLATGFMHIVESTQTKETVEY